MLKSIDFQQIMNSICYFCFSDKMEFIGRDPELKVEIFHCQNCGLIQSPRVGSLYLKNFYSTNCREQRKESFTAKYREFMDKRGEAQYEFISSSSPDNFLPKRVLDVGAGIGTTLMKYKDADELIAIEYDKKSIAELESRSCIHVSNETIIFSPEYKDYFDLIILSHVFEHVNDPLDYLYKLYSVLAPQGLVFIEVPNEPLSLVSHNLARGRSEGHLFNYTPNSLNSMITKSKLFDVLSINTFSIDVASYIEGESILSHWGANSSGDGVHVRALLQKNESVNHPLFSTFVDTIVQSRERDIILLRNNVALLEENEKKQSSLVVELRRQLEATNKNALVADQKIAELSGQLRNAQEEGQLTLLQLHQFQEKYEALFIANAQEKELNESILHQFYQVKKELDAYVDVVQRNQEIHIRFVGLFAKMSQS